MGVFTSIWNIEHEVNNGRSSWINLYTSIYETNSTLKISFTVPIKQYL